MSFNINQKIWLYVERLYIHCYSSEEFIVFLKQFGIDYNNKIYKEFGDKKSIISLYTFMSKENYDFANFILIVPAYKYLPILEKIVFDEKIKQTQNDGWNYYGEPIKRWYPAIINLLKAEGITFNNEKKKLLYKEQREQNSGSFAGFDFLPYDFKDMFLDYIRKEINECYNNRQFLAVMILSRKLLENLFIRILQVVFPKMVNQKYCEENHFVWYDKNCNRYKNFDELIENMKDNSSKFDEDKKLIEEICSLVKPFKDETNLYVHYDYKIPDEPYIKDWKIEKIVFSVRNVYKKYCNP